jgi:hypothetical protein
MKQREYLAEFVGHSFVHETHLCDECDAAEQYAMVAIGEKRGRTLSEMIEKVGNLAYYAHSAESSLKGRFGSVNMEGLV